MYEGHPYGHYVGGTVAALRAMKLETSRRTRSGPSRRTA